MVVLFSSDYHAFKSLVSQTMAPTKALIVVDSVSTAVFRMAAVSPDFNLGIRTVSLDMPLPATLSTDFPQAVFVSNTIYLGQGISLG